MCIRDSPNGMGKSTLLKIMAGLEEVSNGDAKLTPGYTAVSYTHLSP